MLLKCYLSTKSILSQTDIDLLTVQNFRCKVNVNVVTPPELELCAGNQIKLKSEKQLFCVLSKEKKNYQV